MTTAERRLILDANQTAKLVWILILVLEGVALAIVLIGIVFGASLFGTLTSNVSGAQKAVASGAYVVAAFFYILLPLLLFFSTFRLDKWVRWLMWINVLLFLPSIISSVRGFFSGLLAILIAVGYMYVLRQVYSKQAPLPGSPTAPTQPPDPLTQTSGSEHRTLNTILIVAGVLIILGSGFLAYSVVTKSPSAIRNVSEQINGAFQGDANRVLANVRIPLAVDPGIFLGNLEQFDFKSTDLPQEYGPYTLDRRGNGYYKDPKVLLANDKDAQQFYESGLANNIDGTNRVIAHIQVATFTTTYGSSLYYAVGKDNNDEQETDKLTFSTFTGIPYEHYVAKDTGAWSGSSTLWSVVLLNSNAVFFLNLTMPNTTSQDQVQNIVQSWLKNVDNYRPGTRANIEEENANGQTIGGSQ